MELSRTWNILPAGIYAGKLSYLTVKIGKQFSVLYVFVEKYYEICLPTDDNDDDDKISIIKVLKLKVS